MGVKCDGDGGQADVEENANNARRRRTDAYDDTNTTRLLRDEGNGTSHLGQTTPLGWLTRPILSPAQPGSRLGRTCTRDRPPHARPPEAASVILCRGIDFLHSLFPWNSTGLVFLFFFYSADES